MMAAVMVDAPVADISVPCPLCGADRFRVLYTRYPKTRDAALDARISVDVFDDYGRIVKCGQCGLVYRNPQPRPEAAAQAYIDVHDPTYADEDHPRAINAHVALHFLRPFKSEGRLLDVGCFTGHVLNAARLHFDVVGVEPSAWAAEIARDRMKLNVVQSTFESAKLDPESFDVVTMVDVIEHFADPVGAIKKAAAILKPGGALYLVTPNIASMSARILRGRWWGLRSAHLTYFSPETLNRLLVPCGFRIARIRSFGRMFTYGYWLSRLKNYPRWIYGGVAAIVRGFGLGDKIAYLNTFDSIELCAIKHR